MALTSAGFISRVVDAADGVRGAHRPQAFGRAVWGFAELLGTVPDYPASDFSDEDVARLGMLAEEVIDQIEERARDDGGSPKAAQDLVSAVYSIRSRLEQIELWKRHFARIQ